VSALHGKILGILLATSPENSNTKIAGEVVKHALNLGVKVKIFLMDDGIYNLNDKDFQKLIDTGAEVSLCSTNAEKRGIKKADGVNFGSQYDHAEILRDCDKYLGFFK